MSEFLDELERTALLTSKDEEKNNEQSNLIKVIKERTMGRNILAYKEKVRISFKTINTILFASIMIVFILFGVYKFYL